MDYIVYIIIILIVVVLVYLPRKSQDKALRKMQSELKVNDKIITYSGLSGKIEEINEDKLIVLLNPDRIRITLEKWSVAGIDERRE